MLTIRYKGQEISYPLRIEASAYTVQYTVDVDGMPITFESDEEGHYRAFIPKNRPPHGPMPSKELLAAVCEALETL
jgi:hypothetical protein